MKGEKIVLHDYFESAEGGGRLTLLLAREFGADLAYGYKVKNHPFFSEQSFAGRQFQLSRFSSIPLFKQFMLARNFATRAQFLSDYNCALYSGFYAPLAVHFQSQGKKICYCHTPPRFIYDQKDFYLNSLPAVSRPFLRLFIKYLQPRYESALDKMDVIVANSFAVQKRIFLYLGKKADMVYPPCQVNHFNWQEQGDYYLSTARLDPLKRVDLVVKAFVSMPDKKLIVASGGPELAKLKKLAAGSPNIYFTDWCSEKKLVHLLSNCIATLYLPKDEDFGMSPVESMAAGKPVIGVAEGGLLETILQGETGILLDADSISEEEVCRAVRQMTPLLAIEMRKACEKRAMDFCLESFIEKMKIIFR